MARVPRRRIVQAQGQQFVITPAEDGSTTEATGGSLRRGSRPVKEYYIYDSEFRELKRTGAIATVLFAVGSAAMGFVGNIMVGLALSENVSDAVKSQWTAYRNAGLIAAAICYLFAIMAALSGYNRVEQIKAETSHGDEKYTPRSIYVVTLRVLAVLVVLGVGIGIGKYLISP